MANTLKCPVCGALLTQAAYDKALGLWKDKQEHIRHLEQEQRKLEEEQRRLKEREKLSQRKLAEERKKMETQAQRYRQQALKREKELKQTLTKVQADSQRSLQEQKLRTAQQLEAQRIQLQKTFSQKVAAQVKAGIQKGVEEQKSEYEKQQAELKKTQSKMAQLENSLKLSAKRYEQASEEIQRLKKQIEQGITPQIEGLLEEDVLLAKLQELFPRDRIEHHGKGGDILHFVVDGGKEVGCIVYECKKVKKFDKNHVEQAKRARAQRKADFAVLVTNAFPARRQYYFVDKTVFVISPASLEPIVYTLRESLIKIAILRISNEAKQKAVQQIYDYLSSGDYTNKMNDIASQFQDLGKELKSEIAAHKRMWEKRYQIYNNIYGDIGLIEHRLKVLVQSGSDGKQKLLPEPKKRLAEIAGLKP
jgi:hypothetical protein